MVEDTVEVDRETLEELRDHAAYASKKLTKTMDWPLPTQKTQHIRDQLDAILEGEDVEEFEFDDHMLM